MWPFTSPTLTEAAFILRRLAWADRTSCTRYLRRVLERLARERASAQPCQSCQQHGGDRLATGASRCCACPLRPPVTAQQHAIADSPQARGVGAGPPSILTEVDARRQRAPRAGGTFFNF